MKARDPSTEPKVRAPDAHSVPSGTSLRRTPSIRSRRREDRGASKDEASAPDPATTGAQQVRVSEFLQRRPLQEPVGRVGDAHTHATPREASASRWGLDALRRVARTNATGLLLVALLAAYVLQGRRIGSTPLRRHDRDGAGFVFWSRLLMRRLWETIRMYAIFHRQEQH